MLLSSNNKESSATTFTTTNERLVKFLPELASLYGEYPLRYNRWLDPGERGPNGEPCFIVAVAAQDNNNNTNKGVKKHYVWGPDGPKGPGYYHLLTQTAYTHLCRRIDQLAPMQGYCCCTCSAEIRNEMDEWSHAKQVVYSRRESPVPADHHPAAHRP